MSYSDMMAALLLMFVLLLFLSFNRYVKLQEMRVAENLEKETQLEEQERQLRLTQSSLLERDQELASLQLVLISREQQLALSELDLTQNQEMLAQNQEQLTIAQATLILQQQDINEKERLLSLSQKEIDEQKRLLEAYAGDLSDREVLISQKDAEIILERLRVAEMEHVLTGQAAQIDELVGVRARIIRQLRDAFVKEGLNIAVDSSGAIQMDSTVFFDTGKYSIKDDGRNLLHRLLPVYYRTLMNPENAEFISEIIIEGHTDSVGSYASNLDLSQRRAQAVVNFCLSDEFVELTADEKANLMRMITANGRSQSQLIYTEGGEEDRAASRRVEIKFRLKDAEMVESMAKILAGMAGE